MRIWYELALFYEDLDNKYIELLDDLSYEFQIMGGQRDCSETSGDPVWEMVRN